VRLFGATLAGYQDANTFHHFGWGTGAFGEEDVGADGAVGSVDGTGDDHGGQARVKLLGTADEFVAVHLGHQEIAEQQVECARKTAVDEVERFLRVGCCDDVVAAGFEEKGANGQNLLVIVNAKDGLLGTQCDLASAGRHRKGGLAADGLERHVAGWQCAALRQSGTCPGSGWRRAPANGGLRPVSGGAERKLQRPLHRRAVPPGRRTLNVTGPRGAREILAAQVATRVRTNARDRTP
jgi:hypothetical protein